MHEISPWNVSNACCGDTEVPTIWETHTPLQQIDYRSWAQARTVPITLRVLRDPCFEIAHTRKPAPATLLPVSTLQTSVQKRCACRAHVYYSFRLLRCSIMRRFNPGCEGHRAFPGSAGSDVDPFPGYLRNEESPWLTINGQRSTSTKRRATIMKNAITGPAKILLGG